MRDSRGGKRYSERRNVGERIGGVSLTRRTSTPNGRINFLEALRIRGCGNILRSRRDCRGTAGGGQGTGEEVSWGVCEIQRKSSDCSRMLEKGREGTEMGGNTLTLKFSPPNFVVRLFGEGFSGC